MQPRVLVFFFFSLKISSFYRRSVHNNKQYCKYEFASKGRQAGREAESSTVSSAPPSWANWLITANSDTTYFLPLTLVATPTCYVCCSCKILFPLELSFNLWAPKLLLKSASFFSISPLAQDLFGARKDSCNSVRLLPVHQLLEH